MNFRYNVVSIEKCAHSTIKCFKSIQVVVPQ